MSVSEAHHRVSIVGTMGHSRVTSIGDKFQFATRYVSPSPTQRQPINKIALLYVLKSVEQPTALIITGATAVVTEGPIKIWILYAKDGPPANDLSYLLNCLVL